MPFLDVAAVEAAAPHCQVVEFFYGDPQAGLVERVHQAGALADWQVGSADEAKAAVQAGCDFIVAQGTEAGGHIRGTVGLLALLDEVLEAVEVPSAGCWWHRQCPGHGRGAGGGGGRRASGNPLRGHRRVWFAPGLHSGPGGGVSGGHHDHHGLLRHVARRPHRALRSAVAAVEAFEGETVGEMDLGPTRMTLPKGATPSPTKDTTGAIWAMALYAGESVGKVERVQSAGEVVRELAAGAERLLRGWG